MNKSMLAGIGIGVAAALGVAAVASMDVFDRGPQYAQVLSATPIKRASSSRVRSAATLPSRTVVRCRMRTASPVPYWVPWPVV